MGSAKHTGHLLVLNGGSSAGKTTLGRKLQSSLDGPWLLIGIDVLIWTLPLEMVGDSDGIQIIDGEIRRGHDFMRLYTGFQQAVVSLVSNGIDVIVDDVFLDGADDQGRWDDALGELPVCWVALRCDPNAAAMREQDRGDRPPGVARAQAASVHRRVRYDIELDTTVMGVDDSCNAVADDLRHRWSISSVRPTDAPSGLPATSAWNPDSTRSEAPWEHRRPPP